jgi:tetratricopeptide (TPR) repeat protein/predicted Ser/Thr protein kinase
MSVDDTQLANTLDSATRARAAVVADGDTLASGDAIAMDGDTLASGHAIAVDTDTLGSGSATGGVSNPRGEPGALPQRLGRYHVLGRLGSGGMGIVFSAYDPDLDRRVALKLLRTDNGGHDSQLRLLREAQALARLSHPNVVQIYDTGALGEQVFIAMEFIRGDDLHTWLGSASRGIDEILRVFLDAGRGLAAAHDAGLVHRDFKPDNVLVGADGRICVADFGLARNHGDEAATQTNAASARPLDMSLTATGAVLGTPTYMSPEQHEGRIADARSDQFSFCVALWEALHGRRPFRGETHSELAIAVTLGTIQDPPADTRAPRRLTEILRRGLLVDPTRRYPSMQALLSALAPTPTRSRGRWLAAAALVSLTGGAGLAFASWRASEAGACSSGADEIATVWADSDRAAVTDALAGDSGAAARIVAGLDTYATGWTEAHRDACLVHHRGEQSSTLLDARMRCLQQRRGALASAVRLLSGRSDSPFDAAQVVARLPALAPCSDVGFVMAEVAIPEDPVLATAVAAAEERVTEARTRFHGGDLSGAERIAEAAVAEARRLEFKPLLAEALLALGTIEMSGPKASEATGHLEEATAVAVATHHDAVAAETFARRIFVEAMANSTPTDVLLAQVPLARAFAQRLPEPASALARASSNEGTVHLARADRTRAAEAFARAVAESDHAIDVDPIERSNYLQYLAYATDDPQQRDSLFARSEAGLLAVLGLDHPLVLQRRLVRAWLMSDLKTSGALLATTCQALRERSPDDTSACAQCNSTLGAIEARLEHTAEARTALAATRICVEGRTTDPGLQLLAKNAAALEALLAGAHADAIAAADTGIAEFAVHRDEPWMAAELAKLELTRGRALFALDRRAEAIAALERAVAGLAASHPEDQYTLPKLALTDARALLATTRGEP